MQETNLKISPYFDDFDPSKNYQKVLFKPGYSVQTRELNTIQSILQNQIEKFGQHVFKDGSVVIPGNIGFNLNYNCVLVQSLVNGIPVENYRENLVGSTITGLSSGVKAEVVQTISEEESEKSTITLYVKYTASGNVENGKQLLKFKNNEVLIDEFSNPVAVTTVQNASDYVGSVAFISAGVYFIRGFFIDVNEQKIILDQYSSTPSYKVGLIVNESVVTSDLDETLYDNALGTTNYSSPGADRLNITATLSKQNILTTEDSNFIELLRLDSGTPVKLVENSIYSELEKNLARRTFDESGSYTLNDYGVNIRESLSDGIQLGVYSLNQTTVEGYTILNRDPLETEIDSINGNDYYSVEVSEGKAYVKGFEVTNRQKQYVLVKKPRKTSSVNNQGVFLNIGSYLKLDREETISGSISPGNALFLKDSDGDTIGECIGTVLTSNHNLYVLNLTMHTKLELNSSTHGLTEGDLVTGSNSGSTGFVEAVDGSNVILRQVTGSFLQNEPIDSSKTDYLTPPSIVTVTSYKLENVRTVQKSSGFTATIKLDEEILTGSSFTVSTGTTLTGITTRFSSELTGKSKLRIGNEIAEVTSVSTGGASVTLTSSVANGTYYNVSKLVCKLISSAAGLTAKVSSSPVKSTKDHSYEVYRNQTLSVSSGTAVISRSINEIIDPDSIVATSGTSLLSPNINQTTGNVVQLSELGNISSVNVYYKYRLSSDAVKKKTARTFKKLIIDKSKSSTNTLYGTRLQDKEYSLAFPDVYKIHAVRESYNSADVNSLLFDYITVNDSSSLNVGDVLTSGLTKLQIIEKGSSNSLSILYLSESKLSNGSNLALPVTVTNNISAVGIYITQVTNGIYKDITDDFSLVKNDTSEFYRVSKLVRRLNATAPKSKIIIVFDYLEHSEVSNDLYTVQSYEGAGIDYEDIPLSHDYTPYTDLLDFRYYISPNESGSGTISDPYRETSSAFDYNQNTISSISSIRTVYPREIFTFDYQFYLGRIDKVFLTENGSINVIRGSESVNPKLPEDDKSGLLLCTIVIPPYLKKVSDAIVTFEKTKGYTMKDIGNLEKRVETVEKYTSLNLLEVSTNSLNILDADGRNRFKNGFLVDKFNSLGVADLNNTDYSASIDTDEYLLRPYPYVNNVSLNVNTTSSTAKKYGSLVTIPYVEIPYITQPYSSRVENLQPFEVFNWVGNLTLDPKKDVWYDTIRTPGEPQILDLEGPIRFLFDRSGASGDQWGAWTTVGTSRGNGGTNIDQTRTGVNNRLDVTTQTINSGDTINQINDVAFCRSLIIDLYGDTLKPDTIYNLQINNNDSNLFCLPKFLNNLQGVSKKFIIGERVIIRPATLGVFDNSSSSLQSPSDKNLVATVVNPALYYSGYGSFTEYTTNSTFLAIDNLRCLDGTIVDPEWLSVQYQIIGESSGATASYTITNDVVKSNSFGELFAYALIPSQTYETGTLDFKVTDGQGNVQGIIESNAFSEFYAQGTEINVTSTITSVLVPEVVTTPIQENRRLFQPDPPPPPPDPPRPAPRGGDPLAQTFIIDTQDGIFATSLDLYFYTKDPTLPVTVTIRTVSNGLPTETVVPFSEVTVAAKDIKTSTDGSVATRFKFPSPVYLSDKVDYCFVVYSPSRKYYLWVSRLGENDVTTNFKIDKQPYVGVLLKSANELTWTPDQYEDIKFNLNRAKFSTGQTFVAKLNNGPVSSTRLKNNSLRFTEDTTTIRVFHPNHGMHSTSNYVKISGVVSNTSNALLSSSLTTSTATSLSLVNLSNQAFNASATGSWNEINNSPVSDSNRGYLKIGSEIISYSGVTNSQFTGLQRGVLGTTAVQHPAGEPVECFNINGIPLFEVNKTHKINKVISLDEYEIITISKANSTIKSGGRRIRASRNIQFEIIQPSIKSISLPPTTLDLSMNTITGTSIGNSLQNSFTIVSGESIQNRVETELSSPRIIPSKENMSVYLPSLTGGIDIDVNMSTTSDNVSPIVDITGSSLIAITNRINKETINDVLDLSSELLPVGGLHSSYITKKVSLENSSTSIKVYFDAIRRTGVDIKVFAKVKGDANQGSFNSMNYIEIPALSYPISETKNNYRAFEYELNGIQEFKEWSIKIVMIGNDQSNVPFIKNFRAIALAL